MTKLADRAARHLFGQRLVDRMVAQDMADHQDAAAGVRGVSRQRRVGGVERDRLLDQNVLAGGDGLATDRPVKTRRQSQNDTLDGGFGQHRFERKGRDAEPIRQFARPRRVVIRNRR